MSLHKAEEVLKKGSLKTFIRVIEEHKVDIFDRNAFLFRQAIQYSQFNILRYLFLGEYYNLLESNEGIRETLLRRADDYLYFLVSNDLIKKSAAHATIVLQASAGKKAAMDRMITLYQFGFPVLELDLGQVFADSASRLDGAKIIQKYLRSLLIPEADEQVVAGKDGQMQLL